MQAILPGLAADVAAAACESRQFQMTDGVGEVTQMSAPS